MKIWLVQYKVYFKTFHKFGCRQDVLGNIVNGNIIAVSFETLFDIRNILLIFFEIIQS